MEKKIRLLKQFVIFIDASTSLLTPQIPLLEEVVIYLFKSVLEVSPQAQVALGILEQSKAFLETDFTQNTQDIQNVFEEDRFTQQDAFSITSGLKLLYEISDIPTTCLLINMSRQSLDNENLFDLVRKLKQKDVILHSVSVGADIRTIKDVTEQLSGQHFLYQDLRLLR